MSAALMRNQANRCFYIDEKTHFRFSFQRILILHYDTIESLRAEQISNKAQLKQRSQRYEFRIASILALIINSTFHQKKKPVFPKGLNGADSPIERLECQVARKTSHGFRASMQSLQVFTKKKLGPRPRGRLWADFQSIPKRQQCLRGFFHSPRANSPRLECS